LAYTAHVKAYNRAQMLAFCHELKAMGIRYLESNTNFLLLNFDGQTKTAKQAFDDLYKNGIAGRMFNSNDYRNMLRITIGLEDEMRKTATVLRAFIQGD
jgi:histidinol-phosphate aminotransferase